MAYHTSVYLVLFLPLSLLAYQITPQKKRWITLLTCNYLFFWLISGKLVLYLIGTTLFVHYIGVWLTWTRVQCKQTVSGMTKAESTEIRKKYKKREKIKKYNVDIDVMIEAKAKDDALFRLVRELKYKTNYKFIDETSFEV